METLQVQRCYTFVLCFKNCEDVRHTPEIFL